MPKPFAENHLTLTERLFQEASRAAQPESYQKSVRKLGIAGIVLILVSLAIMELMHMNMLFLFGEILIVTMTLVWMMVIYPKARARARYKDLREGQGTPQRTTQFFTDCLAINSNGSETIMKYRDLIRVQYTDHLIILYSNDQRAIILDQNRFSPHSAAPVSSQVENLMNSQ